MVQFTGRPMALHMDEFALSQNTRKVSLAQPPPRIALVACSFS